MAATGHVPVDCGSCHACCTKQLIILEPEHGDKPQDYDYDVMDGPNGRLFSVKHRPNGDCIYLGPKGCTIHDRAPVICRAFDCVAVAREWNADKRRAMGMSSHDPVYQAGRKRLKEARKERSAP